MDSNEAPEIVLAAHGRSRLNLLTEYIAASGCSVMRMLAGELVGARVAASTEIPPGKAKIGSTVRYRGGGPGQIVTVTLVYPEAEDRAASRISVLSPEGSALLGLSEGQSILYGTPAGRRKWLIVLRVVSQPAIEEARIGSRQGAPMATAEPELS